MKVLISNIEKKHFWSKAVYLCSVDLEQKKKHVVKGDNGQEFVLFLPMEQVANHRISHPNYGVIEHVEGETEFNVGDGLIVRHFTFEDETITPNIFMNHKGEDLYKANNLDVMFGVVDGELIPREGVLLCEGIEGKFLNTTLELTGEVVGKRRDIARVLKTWRGCDIYKEGDIILLAKGGDYLFEWEGKEYTKVDHYFNDVIAVVPSEDWYTEELRTHAKDHNETRNVKI
jgi:hypothetical protein